jgi:hypothetical protein
MILHIPSVYTGPPPRIVCPFKTAHGSKNCIHCCFGGNRLLGDINDYLLYLIKRERNNKKVSFLREIE